MFRIADTAADIRTGVGLHLPGEEKQIDPCSVPRDNAIAGKCHDLWVGEVTGPVSQ